MQYLDNPLVKIAIIGLLFIGFVIFAKVKK